jgi:hypothetical protein
MARSRQVITIRADFNHLDGRGRLILSDLRIHENTPFSALAAAGKPILLVQGEDTVFGSLLEDPDRGWCGVPDWARRMCSRNTRSRISPAEPADPPAPPDAGSQRGDRKGCRPRDRARQRLARPNSARKRD